MLAKEPWPDYSFEPYVIGLLWAAAARGSWRWLVPALMSFLITTVELLPRWRMQDADALMPMLHLLGFALVASLVVIGNRSVHKQITAA